MGASVPHSRELPTTSLTACSRWSGVAQAQSVRILRLKARSALPQLRGLWTSGGARALRVGLEDTGFQPLPSTDVPLAVLLVTDSAQVCTVVGVQGSWSCRVSEEILSLTPRSLLTPVTPLLSRRALQQQRTSCRKHPGETPGTPSDPLSPETASLPLAPAKRGGRVTLLKQGLLQERLQAPCVKGCWPHSLEAVGGSPGPRPCGSPCLVPGSSRYPQASQSVPRSPPLLLLSKSLVSSPASHLFAGQPRFSVTLPYFQLCLLVFAFPDIV